MDLNELPVEDVLERLIRASHMYKTKTTMAKADPNSKCNIQNFLYNIDYSQKWDHKNSSFDTMTTFSLLDWKISDKII